jgi:hypothetical protein
MRSVLCGLIAFVVVLGAIGSVEAQLTPTTTRIVRVTGPVEVRLGGGSAPWTPATVGARLAEQDEIRALAGASAELSLPDGSTLILAENSRFVVSRLRVDSQSQGRSVIVHLVTGKVRAIVAQAAVRLVQLRQSTFAISTPAAVAAVRGTDLAVTFSSPMAMAVRNGEACCIAVSTGIGIPVPDGFTTDSGSGFICTLPKHATPQEEQLFFATINPAGVLHPMMNLPATIVDPTLIESWGCDEPAARLRDETPPAKGLDSRPEGFPVSPSTLRQRLP